MERKRNKGRKGFFVLNIHFEGTALKKVKFYINDYQNIMIYFP